MILNHVWLSFKYRLKNASHHAKNTSVQSMYTQSSGQKKESVYAFNLKP